MNEIHSRIYMVKDNFGNQDYAACGESCDVIQIQGLKREDGTTPYFESDAYHLANWCESHGFQYRCILRKESFDELWEEVSDYKNHFPDKVKFPKIGGKNNYRLFT